MTQSGAPLTVSISPTSRSFTSSGGTGSISVTTASGCSWTATEGVSWIAITSGSSGSGNGTVTYSVSANTSCSSRSATITVGDKSHTVTQSGAPLTVSISPTSRSFTSSGGTGSISVTTASGCSWTATEGVSWIAITSGSSGSGNGTVTYSVSANTSCSSRSATITVGDKSHTVTQAGVTPVISGYVRDDSSYGISGVTLTFSNGGGTATTSSSGYYSRSVSCGWSGTVTPSLSCYSFSPTSRSYSSVTSNQSSQNYTGNYSSPRISGYVRTSTGTGISGVTLTFSDGGGTATTDSYGYYSRAVSCGWSGTVIPSKSGYTFSPASRSYSNVTLNQYNQNYTSPDITENDIIGNWEEHIDIYCDGSYGINFLTFYADHTFDSDPRCKDYTGKWTLIGNTISFNYTGCDDPLYTGTVSKSDSDILMKGTTSANHCWSAIKDLAQ